MEPEYGVLVPSCPGCHMARSMPSQALPCSLHLQNNYSLPGWGEAVLLNERIERCIFMSAIARKDLDKGCFLNSCLYCDKTAVN